MKKELFNKVLKSTFGLFVFSIGDYFAIVANIGLAPWDSLTMGVANTTSISYGKIMIVISCVIIAIDLLLKEKIGFGTILDAVLVGSFIDLFNLIFDYPKNNNLFLGLIFMVLGLLIMALGQVFYMSSGLSCGPRDTLMVAIGKRLPKLNIGYVDVLMKIVLIAISFLVKGPIGIGTLIAMLGMGVAMKIVFKMFKFEPRDIKHQSIFESIKIII